MVALTIMIRVSYYSLWVSASFTIELTRKLVHFIFVFHNVENRRSTNSILIPNAVLDWVFRNLFYYLKFSFVVSVTCLRLDAIQYCKLYGLSEKLNLHTTQCYRNATGEDYTSRRRGGSKEVPTLWSNERKKIR